MISIIIGLTIVPVPQLLNASQVITTIDPVSVSPVKTTGISNPVIPQIPVVGFGIILFPDMIIVSPDTQVPVTFTLPVVIIVPEPG